MSIPANASLPGGYADTKQTSFIASSGTLAHVLADVAVANGNYLGGQRVYDVVVTSTDTVANALLVWEGVQTSLYANMGTVTTTATTNATITRTTGSFLTDGWNVGDGVTMLGAVSAANNGLRGIVTAVTATTLTLNGVPTGMVAETEAAGFRLIKTTQRDPVIVPANAGNATSVSAVNTNVQVVGSGQDATRDPTGIELGLNSMLLVSLYQATSALPAQIQVTAKAALR